MTIPNVAASQKVKDDIPEGVSDGCEVASVSKLEDEEKICQEGQNNWPTNIQNPTIKRSAKPDSGFGN